MDLIKGGELFDKIIDKINKGNPYSEMDTAKII